MYPTNRQHAFCTWVQSRTKSAATITKRDNDAAPKRGRSCGIATRKSAGAEAHKEAPLAPIFHGDTAAQPAQGAAALAMSALVRPGGRERCKAEAKPILGAADKARQAKLATSIRRRASAASKE
jgi:hypothetical protein